MSLPYTRNRTYIDGVTQVYADDMNDLQDFIIEANGIYTGIENWRSFTTITGSNSGDLTADLLWTNIQTANAQTEKYRPTTTSYFVTGGLKLTPGTANTNHAYNQCDLWFKRISTETFFIESSVRLASLTNSLFWFGLVEQAQPGVNTGFKKGAFFLAQAGSSIWTATTGTGAVYGGAATAVSIAATRRLGIKVFGSAVGNKVEFYIDGNLVHTETTDLPPEDDATFYSPTVAGACTGVTTDTGLFGAMRTTRSAP